MPGTEVIADAAVEAAKTIAPELYKDGLQPAIKEVGRSLVTVAKTVNIALDPLRVLIWGYEQVAAYLTRAITDRLQKTPVEEIVTPDPAIAVPVVDALRYTAHKEQLRELYANLLAGAMQEKRAKTVHPAFVEVLKQLSDEDVLLLRFLTDKAVSYFPVLDWYLRVEGRPGAALEAPNRTLISEDAGLDSPRSFQVVLDNLVRLNILSKEPWAMVTDDLLTGEYEKLVAAFKSIELKGAEPTISTWKAKRYVVQVTAFGFAFMGAVVDAKWQSATFNRFERSA